MTSVQARLPSVCARHTVWLASTDMTPSIARSVTRTFLQVSGACSIADNAEIVISELVTNAIAVSRTVIPARPIGLRITIAPDSVMIEVWDHDQNHVPVRKEPDFISESGRGLNIVGELSDDWGWFPLRSGKAVWARLARPEPRAPACRCRG